MNESNDTKGINLLKGNPKTAVRNLSIPLIVSMLIVSMYYFIDSIWIAGLGSDALTAIGFVIPVQYIVLGFGVGLESGIAAVISKYIGQKNKQLADNASIHSVLLSVIIAIILTIIFLIYIRPILVILGASGKNLELAIEYSNIFFAGSIFVVLPEALYGLLRAEGYVKRTMYAMGICGILNCILDPIFIYTLNMGMRGAALATILSLEIVLLLIIYWIYIKQDTYLKPYMTNFKFRPHIIGDILQIGLPATIEFLIMSIVGIIMNYLLLVVSGSDSVAVYQNGWRIISFALEPIIGVSTALVTITGFNYGSRQFDKINTAYHYSIKFSTIIGLISTIILLVFPTQIAYLFTYSNTSSHLLNQFVIFLKYFSLTFLTFPIGMVSTYLFQGFSKGVTSLILTIIREVVCVTIFSYIFAIILNMGLNGVWLGNLVGYTIGAFIAYGYAGIFLKRIQET